MYGKVKMAAAYAAVLIGLTFATGSLISCGPFSSDEEPANVQTVSDIIVEKDEPIPEYYAQDGDETVVKTGVLTSYNITASSNNEAAGYVEYETGYSENGQTVTATATARTGYVLDHWMINGEEATALGSEQTVEIKDITENVSLVAVFEENTDNTMVLRGAPLVKAPSGTVRGNYKVSTSVDSSCVGMGTVSGGLDSDYTTVVQINATANPGFVFDHWHIKTTYIKKEGDDKDQHEEYDETSNPYTIYLYWDDGTYEKKGEAECVAFFKEREAKKNLKISLASMSPNEGAGIVKYNSNTLDVGDTPVAYTAGGEITVSSNSGYYVDNVSFTDSYGVTHTYRPDSSFETTLTFNIEKEFCFDDIYLHAEFSKNKYVVRVIDDPVDGGSSTIQEKDTTGADVDGPVAGQKEIINKNTAVITATPKTGYIFDSFVTSSGTRIAGNQVTPDDPDSAYTLTLDNVSQDITITAKYKKKEVNVTIKHSPNAGGTVQYNSEPEVSTEKDYTFHAGESGFTLTAHPKIGYKFVCWEDSAGNVFNSKQVRIADLSEDREYTAVFTEDRETVKVNIEPSPGAGGTVQYNDNPEVTSKTEYVYKPREESGFTLTANPNEGYRFVCWDDSVGNTYNNKQIRISDLTEDRTYTAVFYEEKTDITVNIEPSPNDGGTVQYNNGPEVSTKTAYTFHPLTESGFTLSANPKEGYEFLCWQDSVGNVLSGRQIRIAELLEDRDYTAVFAQKKSDVRVSIEPSPEEGGTVRYNGEGEVTTLTEYIYHPQTETGFTLSASPRTGYKFQCWEDSVGNVFNTKTIRISNLLEDRTYTAVFVSEDDSDGKGLRVVSEPPSGGHVRRWAADESGKAELTAYPEPGWYFVGWKKEGIGEGIFSRSKRVIVDDESVTYVGCFKKDKDYRPTTDIAEMHFYNEKRRVTRPNYSVTRQTMENLAAVSVEYDRVRGANDLPATHGYKATADVKSYLEGKLAASEIILVEGILTTTKGEVIGTGNITDIDVLMNSAKDITNRKFGERYDSEIVAAVNTQPPADFDGKVRTYLWKETDTQYNDNIYIMYSDKGSDYKETAAIVDEDGTVRFTLEDDLTGTQFVLVRVTIEDNGEKKE